ncbi:MAG: 4-(cytidine 5'-diphospho)-2-C-methyl-D-erythritol kinase [Candidatus Omnitrophota bacterium]|jgi:4-diphosphocytidyl-2-C-methyl-D-erythritol kinase|nr:MAG: 4-(cytidine 5'-diphospho)-2-C-methyl-D-erythritol kinase [Candidatus Omnitrophota bacterium]
MSLVLNSYAKVNLYLRVYGKRPDTYHTIKTVFERVNLSDTITLSTRKDGTINVRCPHPLLPKDPTLNLAFRSAQLLQKTCRCRHGADIKIVKRIPVGSGLAGGSSNAATVLLGLNRIWRLKLGKEELLSLASKLGSDVPFFVYNQRFALGEGRGEKLRPLPSLKNCLFWHILVVPRMHVSTEFIYKKWDETRTFRLTMPRNDVRILTKGLKEKKIPLIAKGMYNSLGEVTTAYYPQIKHIKQILSEQGVKALLMSGSGPAVFGIVFSRKEAVALRRKLRQLRSSWQIFVARTI